jgi:hypothetical protein
VPGLVFDYVSGPPWSRRVRGQVGVYVDYLAWQWVAMQRAKEMLRNGRSFDLVHHVTFGSLTLGTFMGLLGVPLVLGPLGAEPESVEVIGRG